MTHRGQEKKCFITSLLLNYFKQQISKSFRCFIWTQFVLMDFIPVLPPALCWTSQTTREKQNYDPEGDTLLRLLLVSVLFNTALMFPAPGFTVIQPFYCSVQTHHWDSESVVFPSSPYCCYVSQSASYMDTDLPRNSRITNLWVPWINS